MNIAVCFYTWKKSVQIAPLRTLQNLLSNYNMLVVINAANNGLSLTILLVSGRTKGSPVESLIASDSQI